jgi:hypothetical protein
VLAVDDEVLARDVFPAEVLMPDGRVLIGRAFITSHRLVVWREHPRGVLDGEDAYLAEPGSVARDRGSLVGRLQIELDSGTAVVNRGRGCGCGSPLKALSAPVPWKRP